MGFVEFQSKDKYIKHHYSAREMLRMLSSSFSLIFLASLLRYSLLPRSLSLLGVKTFSLASIISVPNALSFDLTVVFKKRVKHLRKLFRYMSNHVSCFIIDRCCMLIESIVTLPLTCLNFPNKQSSILEMCMITMNTGFYEKLALLCH